MARPLRLEFPGAVYHVMSRGNHDQHVFLKDEHRQAFLEIVGETVKRYNWICHGYCLMDDHYHLVVETPDGNLAKGMRQINAVYTQYFNRNEQKGGHLFQGRYKAVLIEKKVHLLDVVRHVVRAPLAAGIVTSPEGYVWSSYAAAAGLEKPRSFLSCAWIHRQFRGRPEGAGLSFAAYVADTSASADPFSQVRGQVLLGTEEFCRKLKPILAGHESVTEIPVAQRLVGRPSLSNLFSKVKKGERDGKVMEAVERWGYSQKEVADHLKLHYSTISRMMKRKSQEIQSAPMVVEETQRVIEVEEVTVADAEKTRDDEQVVEVLEPILPENKVSRRKAVSRKREKPLEDDQLTLF